VSFSHDAVCRHRSAESLTVNLAWNTRLETPTLGGALTLRVEAESLFACEGAQTFDLYMPQEGGGDRTTLFEAAFESSLHEYRPNYGPAPQGAYPAASDLSRAGFSYYSLARICSIFEERGTKPLLLWSDLVRGLCVEQMGSISGRVIAVHLRQTKSEDSDLANADGRIWGTFFAESLQTHPDLTFLLLGDDELPGGVQLNSQVLLARDRDLPLEAQLCAAGLANGFIGMASGICSAAQFSDVPHVIIKHPDYHLDAMERELGASQAYPFAGPSQQLWRTEQSLTLLREALGFVLSAGAKRPGSG